MVKTKTSNSIKYCDGFMIFFTNEETNNCYGLMIFFNSILFFFWIARKNTRFSIIILELKKYSPIFEGSSLKKTSHIWSLLSDI